jgi:hypothetical protein
MPKRSDEGAPPEAAGSASQQPAAPARNQPGAPEQLDDDTGPLRALSFVVLLALAVEIGLLALLGRAAA